MSPATSSPAARRTRTAFETQGFPCTNLANGTERNHEPDERVSVEALEGMFEVAIALVEEAPSESMGGPVSDVRARSASEVEVGGQADPGRRRALPLRRRRRGDAARRSGTPARSGSSRSTTARVADASAARGGRRAGIARDPRRQARRRRASRRSRPPTRELAEEIGKRAAQWEELIVASTPAPGSATSASGCTWRPSCPTTADAEPDEHERIEIVPWRLDAPRRGDRGVRGLEVADRAAVARRAIAGRAERSLTARWQHEGRAIPRPEYPEW